MFTHLAKGLTNEQSFLFSGNKQYIYLSKKICVMFKTMFTVVSFSNFGPQW